MTLIWKLGPCKVRTLIDNMPDPKPHFNTISTYVGILEEKGYVGREMTEGRGNIYFAKIPQKCYRSNLLKTIVRKFFGNGMSIVSQLIEDDELTPQQIQELSDMIHQSHHKPNN